MSGLTFTFAGQSISVSVPFRMAPPGGAATLVQEGRGTPAQIRAATRELLGANSPHDSASLRQLMFDHAIGIDCAGYVRQAAIAARLLPDDANIANDSLSAASLQARGFALVADCRAARPGDIFVLGPRMDGSEPGIQHRAIVYLHTVVPPEAIPPELASKLGSPGGAVHRFQVDSSWGAGGRAESGGVRRETWWYGEATGQWAWQPPVPQASSYSSAAGPYGHAFGTNIFGLFRARSRR